MCETAANTNVVIWRKVEDDFYSPSIHVTKQGAIGINVGGHVIVAPIEDWHDYGYIEYEIQTLYW